MQIRNTVTLIGNLGNQPEHKITDKGTAVTTFRLATNEYFRDAEGQRQTRTAWHNVVAFGKLATLFASSLAKGQPLALTGRINYNHWTDKYEQKRVTTEIIVQDFTFLGRKNVETETDKAETTPASATTKAPAKQKKAAKPVAVAA